MPSPERFLPALAARYAEGKLVPFIGAGMSVPACTGWAPFIASLCRAVGIEPPDGDGDERDRIRIAGRATAIFRTLDHEERGELLRHALTPSSQPKELGAHPKQTVALARFPWELVITTNYDDVYRSAALLFHRDQEPHILGRGIADCHEVLRGLDWQSRHALWTIQGYCGGPRGFPIADLGDRAASLLDQVVVGHREYQEAINLEPHFRRAFGEVFRRRSLFFMGSGMTEDYLINLFSEVQVTHGQRPGSHFAFVHESEHSPVKASFLQDRLGITSVVYADHCDVPRILEELAEMVLPAGDAGARRSLAGRPSAGAFVSPRSLSYDCQFLGQGVERTLKLTLSRGAIEDDPLLEQEAVVVSVGRPHSGDHVYHGAMSHSVHRAMMLYKSRFKLNAVDAHLYQNKVEPRLLLAAARPVDPDGSDDRHDWPDLHLVKSATEEALCFIDQDDALSRARFGLVAGGPKSPWHATHSLVQMLVGLRAFGMRPPDGPNPNPLIEVDVRLIDPQVWRPLTAGRIPVTQLLASHYAPVLVLLTGASGNTETFIYMMEESDTPTVLDIMSYYSLRPADYSFHILPESSELERWRDPAAMHVTALSTLKLTRRR